MVPQFKFTLFNTSLYPSGVSINQPIGWNEVSISLRRDPSYHSLIEYFESGFVWYGKALEKIKEIVAAQGINAIITLTIDMREINTFDNIFTGTLDVSAPERIYDKSGKPYKIKVAILRDTFWARFISKADTKVDLQSTTDLYGGTRTAVPKVTTKLPTQIIKKFVDLNFQDSFFLNSSYDDPVNLKATAVPTNFTVQDELDTNTVSREIIPFSDVAPVLNIKENGDYTFDIRFEVSLTRRFRSGVGTISIDAVTDTFSRSQPLWGNCGIDFFLEVNNGDLVSTAFTKTDFGVSVGSSVFTYSGTLNLKKQDTVRIYAYFTNNLFTYDVYTCTGAGGAPDNISSYYVQWAIRGVNRNAFHIGYGLDLVTSTCPDGFGGFYLVQLFDFGTPVVVGNINVPATIYSGITTPPSYIKVQGFTEFDDTTTDAYLLKDAAESIVSKITGKDGVVNSTVLGTALNWGVLLRGKHVRGYSFTDKPFTLSWNEWFKAVCQIHPFGVGYTNSNELEIEPIADFYSQTPSITLDSYTNLVQTVDQENIYNKLTFQFAKWSAESGSGIDDPQTKREWFTPLQQIGKEFIVNVVAYCASLGIEQTRRNRVELGKDWRLDEDLMLIAVIPDGGDWVAEKNENYDAVTNLLTPDKRYNLRHTPTRIFQRWKNYFQSVLHFYSGSDIVFSSGEGNVAMTSEIKATDTEAGVFTSGVVAENSNFAISSSKIFKGDVYTCDAPLSMTQYNTIKVNRKQCIQLTVDSVLTKFAIMDLKFTIAKGSAKLKLKAI